MGTHLVLKDEATRERSEAALTALRLRPNPPREVDDEYRRTWLSNDGKSGVDYVEDSFLKVRFLWARGEEEESLTARLRASVAVWSRDDLLKHALDSLVENDPEKLAVVAIQVATEMDEYDVASGSVLTAFIKMDEPHARLAGARAMRCVPILQFRSAAVELSGDPDPEVAAVGRELLARIDELHP